MERSNRFGRCVIVSGTLLFSYACGTPSSDPAAGTPASGGAVAQSAANAPASGIDLTAMDRSLPPGDDFFMFVNGAWIAATEIPADRSRWGGFDRLADQASARTRAILEQPDPPAASDVARKARDYYASVLDEASIDAAGQAPLEAALKRIAAIDSKAALARVLGEELRADVDPLNAGDLYTDRLFGLWVSPGFSTPDRNTAYLLQGGLDLPDREYYRSAAPRMVTIRGQHLAHVEDMLRLANYPDPAAAARMVAALEGQIAQAHVPTAESFNVRAANNPWPREAFVIRAPGLDWKAFFDAAHLTDQTEIVVWQPRAVTGLARLVGREPLASWKAWLAFHTIDRRAEVLPKAFTEAWFRFHGTQLRGTPTLPERWKRAVEATNDAMGDAVGQLYVAAHLSPDAKAEVERLVANLIAAFGARIDRLEWMSAATKARAREKLKTLRVYVGYPDRWIDYGTLSIVRGDAYGNAERAEHFEYQRRLDSLHAPVDRTQWWMTPQTVNALNLPLQNAMNFPAAILARPFFDPAVPAAVNYGAIGAVIGHEISHSFDDQGAQFDGQGRLTNWWATDDAAHFAESAGRLAAQYDQYAPFPDLHLNGRQTLSENIADLAGLATAFDAWRASLSGGAAPSVDGFTGEQQFFLSYAQIWRSKSREDALRQQIISDGHAPSAYRTATVRNLDPWYAAFDVTHGQRLFLPPGERVRIW